MKKILTILAMALCLSATAQKWSVTDSCNNLVIHNLSTGRLITYPKQQIWIDTTNGSLAIKQINNNAVIASWTPALISNLPASSLQQGTRILMSMLAYNCVHVTGSNGGGGCSIPIYAGAYVPTVTNISGLLGATPDTAYWTFNSGKVTVSGSIVVDISLPVNSFFVSTPTHVDGEISGVMTDTFGNTGTIYAHSSLSAIFYYAHPSGQPITRIMYSYTYATDTSLAFSCSGGGGGGAYWSLTGNAGTNSTAYLGTTDATDLNIGTNGQLVMQIDSYQNVNISSPQTIIGNGNTTGIVIGGGYLQVGATSQDPSGFACVNNQYPSGYMNANAGMGNLATVNLGDWQNDQNSTYIQISDPAQDIISNANNGFYFNGDVNMSSNVSQNYFQHFSISANTLIGDIDRANGGTLFTVDDANRNISLEAEYGIIFQTGNFLSTVNLTANVTGARTQSLPDGDGRLALEDVGNNTMIPMSPETGHLFFNITTGFLEIWNGSSWKIFQFQ